MPIAESAAYARARSELRDAELAMVAQIERVAELRRALPADTVVEDYRLEGQSGVVELSGLFSSPERTLVLYQFMYGKAQTHPCPMCTMWADGLDRAASHITQRADIGLVAAAGVDDFATHAKSRGWENLRLFSAAQSTIKQDLGVEDEAGNQLPGVSIFKLGPDGRPRHLVTHTAMITEDRWRGLDLLSPVWHVFDLTPEGRGDWYPSLAYD